MRQARPGILRHRIVLLCAGALLLGVTLAACGSSSPSSSSSSTAASGSAGAGSGTKAKAKVKVAWLYYGPMNDGGYNVSQWRKAQALIASQLGGQVQEVDIANVPYSQQATQAAAQAIRSGANLVVDTVAAGTLFTNACGQFPKADCIEVGPAGSYPNATLQYPPNVSGVYHQFWNLEYVMGIVAGLMTKSNTVGFVAPYKLPAIIGSADAFELGCQKVNPACKEKLIVTNDYFNPPAATQAAQTLVNAGADVLHGWTDDPSFCEVAQKRGVRAIGEFLDYRSVCPTAFVTSALWDYGPFYLKEMKLLVSGKWTGHRMTLLPLGGGADVAPWGNNVPAKVKAAATTVEHQIEGGKNPFVGPIYDNTGKLRVPAGTSLSPAFLFNKWTWYVKGITA
ncbi:MAG TPA: BMP family ABC transporter substrate-binding protein [Solirubrobacteraceae bacterium]|nr:BMP family ABC transporter substrate-binding protein [Solirubrobacteraceae bacterium]